MTVGYRHLPKPGLFYQILRVGQLPVVEVHVPLRSRDIRVPQQSPGGLDSLLPTDLRTAFVVTAIGHPIKILRFLRPTQRSKVFVTASIRGSIPPSCPLGMFSEIQFLKAASSERTVGSSSCDNGIPGSKNCGTYFSPSAFAPGAQYPRKYSAVATGMNSDRSCRSPSSCIDTSSI